MTSAQILKCGGLYLVNEIGWSISFKCEYCAEVMHKLGTFLSHILNHLIEIQDAKVSKLINGVLNNERRNNEEESLVSEMSPAELTYNSKAATETNEKVIKTECGDSEKSLQTPFEELSIEFIQQNTATSYDLNIFKDVSSETLQNDENVLHEQIINEMQLHSVENIHAAEKFEIEIFFGGTTEKNSLTGNDTEMGHIYSDDNTTNDSIIPSNKTKQKRKIKSNTPAKNVSKKHSSNEPLKCVHCNKRFLKQRTLKRHLVIHSAQKPYVCDYCNATFADRGNYNVHRRRHLGILPHTCQICNKGFTTTTDLNTHLLSHSDSRPFICDICGATYKSKQQVERHIHRLHSNIRNYSCDVCEKKFFDGKTLSDHYLSHTDERPFECEICKNKFSRKKALVEHIKLHSDIYEYSCPYCDKAFQQRPGLHSHIRNVHRK